MDNTDSIKIVLKYKEHKKVLPSLIVEYLWKNLKNVGSSWIFRTNKTFKISKRVLSAKRF